MSPPHPYKYNEQVYPLITHIKSGGAVENTPFVELFDCNWSPRCPECCVVSDKKQEKETSGENHRIHSNK